MSIILVADGSYSGDGSYTRFAKSCVNNHNLIKYTNKDIAECKALCSRNINCVSFEYGVAYTVDGVYKPRDCQLGDSVEKENCDGSYYNLDLYVKSISYIS